SSFLEFLNIFYPLFFSNKSAPTPSLSISDPILSFGQTRPQRCRVATAGRLFLLNIFPPP
ncbi:hypothetical protein KJ965_05510, partial [Patescibacteria group bacterium]|nr:hypothetical protein [Patescibacteria group bacterium]